MRLGKRLSQNILFLNACCIEFANKYLNNMYPPQPAVGEMQPGFDQQGKKICLHCPLYACHFMAGLHEVLSDPFLHVVTLVCWDGHSVRCNKLFLATCSSYFRQVLALQGNSVIPLPGITSEVLSVLLDFMCQGHIYVRPQILPSVMQAATTLQIKGFQSACDTLPQRD